jgi:hypothetical protein
MDKEQSWKSYNPSEKRNFNDFVAAIVEKIGRGPVGVHNIGDIAKQVGLEANFYPGVSSEDCCDNAFFISLSSKSYRKGRGHYYFNEILQKLIQHMQGACPGTAKRAIVITDSFEPDEFQRWKFNIDEIRKIATVEFYLISGSRYTQLSV